MVSSALCAFGGICGRNALNDQDYAIHERRMKASGKLLLNRFRLATLNAGCGLHRALGVKGQGKKRNDSGEDYRGHPENGENS